MTSPSIYQQGNEPEFQKKIKLISRPYQQLSQRLKEYESELDFMEKEQHFFSWLVQKSIDFSDGLKRRALKELLKGLGEFHQKNLHTFRQRMSACQLLLRDEKNKKYPPSSPGTCVSLFQELQSEMKDLKAQYKCLKADAFELVEDFISIRIY